MPNEAQGNQKLGILRKTTSEDEGLVRCPVLTPHLTAHNIGQAQTLLVSESFNTLLHGQLLCDLFPLLDGKHSLEAVTEILHEQHSPEAVQQAIVSLSSKGYVVSADHSMSHAQAAYWSELGASPSWVEKRLANTCVTVEDDNGFLSQKLSETGVNFHLDNSNLTVYVVEDYLDPRLHEINRHHLDRGNAWMLVRPQGIRPLLGPIFRPDEQGPCWVCLEYRLRNHQEVHAFLRNVAGEEAVFKPYATTPYVLSALYGLIAAEIVKWLILDSEAPIHEHVVELNLGTFTSSKHRVVHRPQCLACGDENLNRADRPAAAIHLESSPKEHLNSGGSRSVAPEITLSKYRHLISPISGVVSWLSRATDESDSWLHVHWSGSNLGMRSRSLSSLRRSLRSKSAGKGSTREQSEVSALCEAIERYSGAYHGDEIRVQKQFTDFRDEKEAIHPNHVQLFSDSQLNDAASINAKGHPYNVVPARFDEKALVDWTPVWSLSSQRHRFLPTSMLYNMPPEQRDPGDLIADSNGCAAGNTLEEAILQGFFELVERDAFAIWWYNRLQVPAVDLASFDDPYLSSATQYYSQYDREVWLLDVTSDLGIPSFVAISRRVNAETEDIIYGAGTHASPQVAALRAICELNQCLSWLPRTGKDQGRPTIDDPLALWWWMTARLENCPWLVPDSNTPTRQASNFSCNESMDTREDVEHYVKVIQAHGMDFLVLDQTRPDIGMPVARVIVPGLRHFWARFAPGRLYDVPVKRKHLEHALSESELNPSPVIA